MPHPHRTRCLSCGKHRSRVGPISWDGNCRKCGLENLTENYDGLVSHSGPAFARWRAGVAASVGAVLLDDARLSPQTADDAA